MSDDDSDGGTAIGVPAAETEIDMNTHEASAEGEPTVATVWVASGEEWVEYDLPAGETMEIELPNGETAAIVQTEEDDDSDVHPALRDYDTRFNVTD